MFKKYVLPALLACLALPALTNAQVRPDIFSFTPAQRTQLADLIIDYVDPQIIQIHCDYTTIMANTSYDIHDDFNFLPFHRTYLEGLEDWLLEQGYPQYVPLPKWTGLVAPPTEFSTAGPNNNGVDPDCASTSTTCANAPLNCNPPSNWTGTVSLPGYLTLPVQVGAGNDLCDWNMNPSAFTTINDQTGSTGLSRKIETPWHNNGHGVFGTSAMTNFRSPSVAIFWLWHAMVDDKWREWQCNCTQSTMLPFDMYMKDKEYVVQHYRDGGDEPNIDNGPMWESEDIWVRKQQDGLTNHDHEDPEYYAISTNFNYVYVQVRNRACVATSGSNQLKVYWSKAGTALSYPSHWNGSLTTTNSQPVGNIIATVTIPSIPAGESYIAEIPWQPVDPANYVNIFNSTDPLFWIGAPEPHHFCLLARIESTNDPIVFTSGTQIGQYVRENNNVAWKNVTVLDVPGNIAPPGGWDDDHVLGAAVLVGDAWGDGGIFDLEFAHDPTGFDLTEYAEVKITLSPHVWNKWMEADFAAENIQIVNYERHQVRVTESPGFLQNLTFDPHERNLLHFGYNFLADQVSADQDFAFRVIQRNSSNNDIVGGETYLVGFHERPMFQADAGPDQDATPGGTTYITAEDIGEEALYKWYDETGDLIQMGIDLEVSPQSTETYTLEVIAKEDGLKDYDEVTVHVQTTSITGLSPNPTSTYVEVSYDAGQANSAYLQITLQGGLVFETELDVSTYSIEVSVDDFMPGAYNVILICDDVAVDSETLIVQ